MDNSLYKFYEDAATEWGWIEIQVTFAQEPIWIDELGYQIDFDGYLKVTSQLESKKLYSEIDKLIKAEKKIDERKLIATDYFFEINLMIENLNKFFKKQNTACFAKDLTDILEILKRKYEYLKPAGSTPKIQWLGKTNLLTTLIFELWLGQDKGKNTPSTPPLIKATKKDLEQFLINNFLDSKGKPLTESTISDYLNSSKPETRAKKGDRIEL